MFSACALAELPEVAEGADLAALILTAGAATPELSRPGAGLAPASGNHAGGLQKGDILAVAHKAVSKAEARVRRLTEIEPSPRAVELGETLGKDPRHVQAILDETRTVLRAERGVLICETHHGLICANAGVDTSNLAGPDTLLLLPRDPDASARRLRAAIRDRTGVAPAVLITDSFGRAWRNGQVDVAIGCAGLHTLDDWRGRADSRGMTLRATWLAVADAIAAAADLARSKDGRQPVVVLRGLERLVTEGDGPGAGDLLRPEAEDLFR